MLREVRGDSSVSEWDWWTSRGWCCSCTTNKRLLQFWKQVYGFPDIWTALGVVGSRTDGISRQSVKCGWIFWGENFRLFCMWLRCGVGGLPHCWERVTLNKHKQTIIPLLSKSFPLSPCKGGFSPVSIDVKLNLVLKSWGGFSLVPLFWAWCLRLLGLASLKVTNPHCTGLYWQHCIVCVVVFCSLDELVFTWECFWVWNWFESCFWEKKNLGGKSKFFQKGFFVSFCPDAVWVSPGGCLPLILPRFCGSRKEQDRKS